MAEALHAVESSFELPAADDELARRFACADPFPHLVLDDVLIRHPIEVTEAFPPPEWPHWKTFQDGYQVGKSFCQDIEVIPPVLRALIEELSAPRFLAWMEAVTGIGKLLPDPYLVGGGLHCSAGGGILAPHTDFHLYPQLDLYRQINVLLYLNPRWERDWGGCLELWKKGADQPTVTVAPTYGRLVVFRTDDRSVHGFSEPITAPGERRRSIALYFYTATERETYAGDTTTYWQEHGRHGTVGRTRLALYRSLLFGSRGLAMLAHRANPNVGFRRRHPR